MVEQVDIWNDLVCPLNESRQDAELKCNQASQTKREILRFLKVFKSIFVFFIFMRKIDLDRSNKIFRKLWRP